MSKYKRKELKNLKIVNKKKLVVRTIEIIGILATIILTPIAINYANELRGHKSYGSEYLIPILGLIIIMIIETIYEERGANK